MMTRSVESETRREIARAAIRCASGTVTCGRRQPTGFTLVELLVVIAIVGVLVALLLPAVQAAREAARRTQCVSHMKQVSLAVVNYESARKSLPPAGLVGPPRPRCTLADTHFNPRSAPQIGWLVLILPFVEENALYDQFDRQRDIVDQGPHEPQSTEVASYFCPSDRATGRRYSYRNKWFAKANMAAYGSPFRLQYSACWPGALGGFTPGSTVGQRLRRIGDGLSRTLLVTEVRARDHEQDQRGAWVLPWVGSSLLAMDHESVNPVAGGADLRDIPYVPHRQPANPHFIQVPNKTTGTIHDHLYLCPAPAQAARDHMPCNQGNELIAAPRSLHPNGVNAAAIDGHVGFILNEVDPFVMASIISTNDGVPVDITDGIR